MGDTNQQSRYPLDQDGGIDLKELFLVLWAGKWLIGGISALAAAVSIGVALILPNIYTSSTLLAPAEQSGGGLSMVQQFGGLASLAGVPLPGGGEGSRAQLGMELMKSRAFLGEFVERRKLLPELMAVEYWDMATGDLVYDPEIYNYDSGKWVRDIGPPFQPKPSLLEAHEEFMLILRVSQDKQTGYVSVSIDHESPIIAARWVNWMVEDINAAVRSQDVEEANRSISYLQNQIANTSLAELQTVFFELIESQTETAMLAEVRPEYVFKTIDPAVAAEVRSRPNRALICVLGTLLGGMLSLMIVLIRNYASSNPDVGKITA